MCEQSHPENKWFETMELKLTRLHAFMIANAIIAFTTDDPETVVECFKDVKEMASNLDVEWHGSMVDTAQKFTSALMPESEKMEVKPEKCVGKPIGCGRDIPGDEFVKWDELSRREFALSRMCIHCQNTIFDHVGTINGNPV